MYIFISYIKFLLRSTNQHGVHSPFVYSLVTKCLYDHEKYPSYQKIKKHRKSLMKDKRSIRVNDFGAGSRVFKSDERKISEIAKNVGITPKRARLLNRLVNYLNVKNALELGTSVGLGSAAMAADNKVKVFTIEGCPETSKIAAEKFREFGLNNIELKVGKFMEVLEDKGQWTEDTEKNSKFQIPNSKSVSFNPKQPTTDNSQPTTTHYDLIYIDGNHRKEATLSYFELLLSNVHNDSVMIFDDIHWSQEMEEAWETIKEHPAVKVTIDTFFWGFVFFRREQEKEHFVIRV
ncbi:Methyltransferase domain-containing protein [Salinimicrobium catena]|uniref:Methyltransferase domain-containing protein n=1 Tax=Salinimicrobium catena TaxID=390640 RepID=A0A1H5NBL6_9FLAO|nr:class I SAM-dependent methyltransferase [Salinimicrobium catena]SDL42320.1 Methyltransferase domain-containing protein [Salinimicrobium catena]SEE99029.1 Methyltransferase domain-containing protein [Salinimicrobium catena]